MVHSALVPESTVPAGMTCIAAMIRSVCVTPPSARQYIPRRIRWYDGPRRSSGLTRLSASVRVKTRWVNRSGIGAGLVTRASSDPDVRVRPARRPGGG